jgi:hypothetical protein
VVVDAQAQFKALADGFDGYSFLLLKEGSCIGDAGGR